MQYEYGHRKHPVIAHLFFITSTTPRNIMTNSKMPAMTPAILTVWSVCFSGSGSGFRVAAPMELTKEKQE